MLTLISLLPALYLTVADADRLQLRADPAVATVSRQVGGRQLIRLPALEFPIRIRARCGGGGKAHSVSISIADTRLTISAEEIPVQGFLETSVEVSARQIAPLAVREFCVDEASSGQSLLLSSALTAQASLRCVNDDRESIVFDAVSLDVELVCDAQETTVIE